MMYRAGLLVVLLVLGGCSSWLGFGGSDAEQPAALVDFKPSLAITDLWSRDIGTGPGRQFLRLSPALHGDTFYTVDIYGRVRALALADGKQHWQTDLKLDVSSGVGFGDDLVLVASRKGEVVALDKDKGVVQWRAQVSSEVLAPPAAEGGLVVVQSVDGRLTGLASATGKQVWTVERSEPALSLRGTSTPIILSDAVLTGYASGKIAAVNLKNGRLLWETPVAQPQGRSEIERLIDVDAPALVSGRTLLAAAYQGKIVAVNLENGRLLWARDISTYSSLAVDSSNVYVSDVRGTVYALDLRSGSTVWKQDKLALRRLSAPAVTGNAVAVADFEGYVHWLAREDGRFLARERVASAAVLVAPIADGDTVYVTSQNGYLSALRLGTRRY
jgi:outer membrane protein assembly factor BamB